MLDCEKFWSLPPDSIHVIADFDGTLTKIYSNGEKRPSIISVLRSDEKYLGTEYAKKAHALYDHYSQFEFNPDLDLAFKKSKMKEWWNKHFDLMIEMGIKKEHVQKIAEGGYIEFREGAKEFLKYCYEQSIPVVIMSAAGIGDTVRFFMKDQGTNFPNVHYIVNEFEFNSEGFAVRPKYEVIHSFNKDETVLEDFPEIFEIVKNRRNVLLLGNSMGDSRMADGFDYERLVKIGFLDPQDSEFEKKLEAFNKAYDLVITEGGYRSLIQ